jgi:hypothetical protein
MHNQTKKLMLEIAHARTLLKAVEQKLEDVSEEMFYENGMGALDSAVMDEMTKIACDLRNTIAGSDIAIKKRSEIEDYVRKNAHLGIK